MQQFQFQNKSRIPYCTISRTFQFHYWHILQEAHTSCYCNFYFLYSCDLWVTVDRLCATAWLTRKKPITFTFARSNNKISFLAYKTCMYKLMLFLTLYRKLQRNMYKYFSVKVSRVIKCFLLFIIFKFHYYKLFKWRRLRTEYMQSLIILGKLEFLIKLRILTYCQVYRKLPVLYL